MPEPPGGRASPAIKPGREAPDNHEGGAIRRYQLQLFDPDWDGWHTVVTAAGPEALATSARVLGWQTGKPLRIVDPDGRVVRRIPHGEPDEPAAAERPGAVEKGR